jgi:hypothetical protein
MDLSKKIWMLAVLVVSLSSGCGGGASTTLVNTTTSITGTAATGAAIVGGIVTLKCTSGMTSSPTTGADGAFTVDLGSATLPCLAKVSYQDVNGTAQELHSLATNTGTLNVTPLTEMVLAAASGGSPSALFTTPADLSAIAAKLPAALATVKARLDNLGVDTTNLPKNPISDKFTPAMGNVGGDAADQVLDDLKKKLAISGRTLKSISAEVAIGQTSNDAISAGTSGTGSTATTTTTTTATTTTAIVTSGAPKTSLNLPTACTGTTCPELRLLAGTPAEEGNIDGLGTDARVSVPSMIVMNPDGSYYFGSSNGIRLVSATGSVSSVYEAYMVGTVTTGSSLSTTQIRGLAKDSKGSLYYNDTSSLKIYKIGSNNVPTVYAGSGATTNMGIGIASDGVGTQASFKMPGALVMDSQDNLYVSDCYGIRKITPQQAVTTVITPSNSTCLLQYNQSLAIDSADNVYYVSTGGIGKLAPNGTTTTLAVGSTTLGYADGVGQSAQFRFITALAVDTQGSTVYVGDERRLRKIDVGSLMVTTIAGTSTLPIEEINGTGNASKFISFGGLAVDPSGNILSTNNCCVSSLNIRKITPAGVVIPVIGTEDIAKFNTYGNSASTKFRYSGNLSKDYQGNLYINPTDSEIIKITPSGITSTEPIINYDVHATWASGKGKLTDSKGNSYGKQGNIVIKTSLTGTTSTVANITLINSSVSGNDMALDASDNFYAYDVTSYSSPRIVKVSSQGILTTVYQAGQGSLPFGSRLTVDSVGNIYTTGNKLDNTASSITRITPAGVASAIFTGTYMGSKVGSSQATLGEIGGLVMLSDKLMGIAASRAVYTLTLP